ncbi:hypothetical protein N9164_15315 [Draconibacterium sp.]|nr:hypothetical protein [Draconibacterium sp.]
MRIAKKKLLKLPEYPGEKEAFKNYINENLVYPKEVLEKQLEGIVYLTAEIKDNRGLERIWIIKS